MKYTERKQVRGVVAVKQKGKFRTHLVRGLIGTFFSGIIFSGVYYGTRLPSLTIQDITVAGGETVSHEEVRARVVDALRGNYFFLIPKSFTLLYPREYIQTRIGEIARVYDVQIIKIRPTALSVSFKEYIPHALVCAKDQPEHSCLFMDETGYAFALAPNLTGGALVRYYVEVSDAKELDVGIDTNVFQMTNDFIVRTERELGLRITEVFYKENGDLEFSISGGGAIYATTVKDIEEQFSNLQSVLASKEFMHIRPGNFQYIDIRFDTKIFVNEEMSTTTATSTVLSE